MIREKSSDSNWTATTSQFFKNKIHFAGHYAAMYGYDESLAYRVDTNHQGLDAKTSFSSPALALARSEKGPISSNNRFYTITKSRRPFDSEPAVPSAIPANATDCLNHPITNIGYRGILKTRKEVFKWFESSADIKRDSQTTAMIMELAGTGDSKNIAHIKQASRILAALSEKERSAMEALHEALHWPVPELKYIWLLSVSVL